MTDLLVSESTDSMFWIADGAIWTADFGDQDVFAEEESDAGQET
jgi:hypothetical protein